MKIGNYNLPDKVNVLGTEYKIKYSTEEKGYEAVCTTCCWFYDSKFEVGVSEGKNEN